MAREGWLGSREQPESHPEEFGSDVGGKGKVGKHLQDKCFIKKTLVGTPCAVLEIRCILTIRPYSPRLAGE